MSLVRAGLIRPTLVAQIVRSSLVSSGSTGSQCNLYYFNPTDADQLDFGTAFTGNFKANIATFNGNTGVNSQITTTLINSPESARNDASLLVWNQVDLDVTAMTGICDNTFDGVVPNYAKDNVWFDVNMGEPDLRWYYDFTGSSRVNKDIAMQPGDVLTFMFAAPPVISSNQAWFDSAGGASRVYVLNAGDNINFSSDIDLTLDGVPLVTGVTSCPTDGLGHVIELTATAPFTFTVWGDTHNGSAPLSMAMFNVILNGGEVHSYAVDDGPLAGGVVTNSGTGGNAQLVNEMTADWYEGIK